MTSNEEITLEEHNTSARPANPARRALSFSLAHRPGQKQFAGVPTIKFTRETARAMQAKGQAVKAARVAKLRETIENLRETITEEPQDFRYSMLLSVRSQIKIIITKIDRELEQGHLDTKALRDLGDTLARFEAMEQKLSMRAGPGSLKPTAKPAPRRSAVTVDEDPRPVEAPAEKPAAQISQEDPPAPAAPIAPPIPTRAPAQAAPAESWEAYPPA